MKRLRRTTSTRLLHAGLIAALAAATSCTIEHASTLPAVEPVAHTAVGPIAILGDPIDARSYSTIEQVTDPCGNDIWDEVLFPHRVCFEAFVPPGVRSPQPNAPGVRFTVGPEIAQHANALLENQLVKRGFRVIRLGTAVDVPASPRVVVVTVVSAYQGNDWPVGWTASGTLAIAVQDQSGERIFSQTYTGTRSYGLDFGVMFELLESRQAELSKAFDDAAAKACDDPAFIAAITPSSGKAAETKSTRKMIQIGKLRFASYLALVAPEPRTTGIEAGATQPADSRPA